MPDADAVHDLDRRRLGPGRPSPPVPVAGPSALTIAELRVLRFLPSHLSFREIAGRLHVSPNTVKTQAHGVYRKLGAASRSEAVARARTVGLATAERRARRPGDSVPVAR